jgi:serine/threonine-protein kinase
MKEKREGQMLGKYEILEKLGAGGFATVYSAVDTTLDREVALKVLDPLLMRDEPWVERFQQEARAIARLSDPHIVTIHEVGNAEGRLFIAMELIEKPSLDGLIAERGQLPWEETLEILEQVAQALDCAHNEGIVHGDLKLSDILMDPDRGAMVSDFALTRLATSSSMSLSISDGAMRSLGYTPPEIWAGKEATARTDVYALACIAYEMLMGESLFAVTTPAEAVRKHVMEGAQLPAEWAPGIPGTVSQALKKALEREPERRYHSASDFVAALRESVTSAPERPDEARTRSVQGLEPAGQPSLGRLTGDIKAISAELVPSQQWQRLRVPLLIAGIVGTVGLVAVLGRLSVGAYQATRAGVGPSPGGIVVGILADAITIIAGLGLLVTSVMAVVLMLRALTLLTQFLEVFESLVRMAEERLETDSRER